MKVILREEVKPKGSAGQIIDVKTGYARNYLIPEGLAYIATEANIKTYDREKVLKSKKMDQMKSEAEKLRTELEKISLTSAVKVDDDGRLYGSVTSNTISDLLKEKGFDINQKKISIDEHIKELGVYEAKIEIVYGVDATVKVWVVKE